MSNLLKFKNKTTKLFLFFLFVCSVTTISSMERPRYSTLPESELKKIFEKSSGFEQNIDKLVAEINNSDDIEVKNLAKENLKTLLNISKTLLKKEQINIQILDRIEHTAYTGITIADKELKDIAYQIYFKLLSKLMILVKKNQAFEQATIAATNAYAQAIKQEINAISNNQTKANSKIQVLSIKLYKLLVEKLITLVKNEQFFEQATETAILGSNLRYKPFKNLSKNLFEKLSLKLETLVKNGQAFDQAAQTAIKGIQSNDDIIRDLSFNLFNALFKKGQAFEQATQVAVEAMNNDNEDIKNSALVLFKLLIENDKAFEQATKAAVVGIKSKNIDIKFKALKLFNQLLRKLITLVKNGQVFKTATQVAVEAIKSEDYWTRNNALNLFEALFKNGQAFEQATQVAVKTMNNDNEDIKISALELFKLLVENDKAFEQATKAANEAIKSKNNQIRLYALNLFKSISSKLIEAVKNEQAFEQATQLAVKGINIDILNIRNDSLNLFEALFKHRQAFEQATQVAVKIMNNDNEDIKISALELFKLLVENDKAFEQATKATSEAIKSKNNQIRLYALNLFRSISSKLIEAVKNEQAFEQATQLAVKGINIDILNIRNDSLNIFEALFKRGQAFEQATQVAVEAINNDNEDIKNSALVLFKLLVENDKAFEQATKAANTIIDQAIKTNSASMQIAALQLFEALVKKDKAFEPAIKAAIKAIQSNILDYKISALYLFKALVEKKQAFEPATAAVFDEINSDVIDLKNLAQEIFIQILNYLKDPENSEHKINLLNKIDQLTESNKYYNEARQICDILINDLDTTVKNKTVELLEKLNKCVICYDDTQEDDRYLCTKGHAYCGKAIQELVQQFFNKGGTTELKCSHEFKDDIIPDGVLKKVLSQEKYKEFDELRALELFKKDPNFYKCPFCTYGTVIKNLGQVNEYSCPKCGNTSCTKCREKIHPDKTCLQAKYDRIDNINTFFALAMDEFLIRTCASCGTKLVKFEACNKIICEKCDNYTCYHCGQSLEHGTDEARRELAYLHFGESLGKCPLYAPGKTDDERNKYYYDKAKELALTETENWLNYRLKNKLEINGLKDTETTNNIKDILIRLDGENQFN